MAEAASPQPLQAAVPGSSPQASGGATGRRRLLRIVLLALGAAAMLAGLHGGLARLGWALPGAGGLASLHGPVMICGVFGTLIGLERAVATGGDWPYLAPVLSASGTLALLTGLPGASAILLQVAAAAILVAASHLALLRQPAVFTGTLLAGAIALLAGNVLWLAGAAASDVAGWWLTFLILTIAGERLELSRVLPPRPGGEALFLLAVGLTMAGVWNGFATADGATLFGSGLLTCVAWLVRHDIALRNIGRCGQTGFSAACMLLGYGWLAVAGILLLVAPPHVSAASHDAAVHAITIGFVLSMVLGHAFTILPAITGLHVQYHALMRGPLALLHAAVAMRVGGGMAQVELLRGWSGPLAIAALVAFAGVVVHGASRHAKRTAGESTPRDGGADPGRSGGGDGRDLVRRFGRPGEPRSIPAAPPSSP